PGGEGAVLAVGQGAQRVWNRGIRRPEGRWPRRDVVQALPADREAVEVVIGLDKRGRGWRARDSRQGRGIAAAGQHGAGGVGADGERPVGQDQEYAPVEVAVAEEVDDLGEVTGDGNAIVEPREPGDLDRDVARERLALWRLGREGDVVVGV